ncbi:MAG: hypothetical protein Q8P91_02205 [bacterium]|nr:hypothetical protein [bacterium]
MNKTRFSLVAVCFLIIFGLFPAKVGATPEVCRNISIELSPQKSTYSAGETVQVRVNHANITTPVAIHFLRTTQDTKIGKNWTQIPLNTAGTLSTGSWIIPDTLNAPFPYDKSNNQEFILSVSVVDNQGFVCSGNPEIPVGFDPKISCDSCRTVVVSEEPREPSISINNLWITTSGFSYTFDGRRLDYPDNQPNFTSRIEYEAPVQLCSNPELNVIPQTFTKSNPWGYWGPHIVSGNPGRRNLRFFLTSPSFNYPWQNDYLSAVGFKTYDNPDVMNVQTLGKYLKSIRLVTFQHDNYYFPPYFQSFNTLSKNNVQIFTRIDIAGKETEIPENNFCVPFNIFLYEDHNWLNRARILTDQAIIDEIYNTLSDDSGKPYFENKDIYVIQFFESAPALGQKPFFREDWYFMEGVGLVGIDDISWVENFGANGVNIPGIDSSSCQKEDSRKNDTEYYFCKDFLREEDQTNKNAGHAASKFVKLRLKRAYLGEPLEVFISPAGTTGTYSITAVSSNSRMPYDGWLEFELTPGEISDFVDTGNNKIWIENGQAVVKLPDSFPIIDAKFRAKVAVTPSSDEKVLPYEPMPWSVQILSRISGDFNNDGKVDIDDYNKLVTEFGRPYTIFDFNILVENWGKPQ